MDPRKGTGTTHNGDRRSSRGSGSRVRGKGVRRLFLTRPRGLGVRVSSFVYPDTRVLVPGPTLLRTVAAPSLRPTLVGPTRELLDRNPSCPSVPGTPLPGRFCLPPGYESNVSESQSSLFLLSQTENPDKTSHLRLRSSVYIKFVPGGVRTDRLSTGHLGLEVYSRSLRVWVDSTESLWDVLEKVVEGSYPNRKVE